MTRWFSFVNFLKTTSPGIGPVVSTGLLAVAGAKGLALARGPDVVSSVVAAGLVLRAEIPGAPPPQERGQGSAPGRALRDRRFMADVS